MYVALFFAVTIGAGGTRAGMIKNMLLFQGSPLQGCSPEREGAASLCVVCVIVTPLHL